MDIIIVFGVGFIFGLVIMAIFFMIYLIVTLFNENSPKEKEDKRLIFNAEDLSFWVDSDLENN